MIKLFLGIAIIAILMIVLLTMRRGGTSVTTIETHRASRDEEDGQ